MSNGSRAVERPSDGDLDEAPELLLSPFVVVIVVIVVVIVVGDDESSSFASCCIVARFAKKPLGIFISSPCVPCSTMLPLYTTAIESAFVIVDNRCATTTVVRRFPRISSSKAACTTPSLSLSSADVASSSSSTVGSLITARAIAMRCFCPPLNCTPRSPTSVPYPSGKAVMKP